MNKWSPGNPAYGQVLVLPLAESQNEAFKKELQDLTTAVIFKPRTERQKSFLWLAGGMLESKDEPFVDAAARKLIGKTRILCEVDNFTEMFRIQKRRQRPDKGKFDVALFMAFECDFTTMFDPLWREFGKKGEEVYQVSLADLLNPEFKLAILTTPSLTAGLFLPHYKILKKVFLK